MKTSRSTLEKYLLERFRGFALNSKIGQELAENIKKRRNMPQELALDIIARGLVIDRSDFHLYCILEGIAELDKDKELISKYFTDFEIADYSTRQLESFTYKFPIEIECYPVGEGQWIGHTNTNFFMDLRRAQMITYNERAQRALTQKIVGGEVQNIITVNTKAVTEIQQSLHRGEYIPTTITLNIPMESDADFYYDEERKVLVVNYIPTFDISDGYHRFLGMSKEKNVNPDFNAPWEIRIINYMEAKTKHFIYQESLKTPMAAIDSEALNAYSPANKVVERLNGNPTFALFGQINNTNGNMRLSYFVKCINHFYFKGIKEPTNADVREAVQDIQTKINCLANIDPYYEDHRYEYIEVLVLFVVMRNSATLEDMDKNYKHVLQHIEQIPKRLFDGNESIRPSDIAKIQALIQEV